MSPDLPYPEVEQQPSFPTVEREILDFWALDRTFEASVEDVLSRLP